MEETIVEVKVGNSEEEVVAETAASNVAKIENLIVLEVKQ